MHLHRPFAGAAVMAVASVAVLGQPGTKLWEFPTTASIYSSPALGVDGTVYVGSTDGSLYAVSATGARLWSFATGAAIVASPALGSDETAYVGSTDGRVYAVSQIGLKKWEFATGGEVRSSPAVGVDGTIYVGSLDGKVYALSPDGARKWEFTTEGSVYSSPAVSADGMIYIGSRDSKLYSLLPNGTKQWEYAVSAGINASPAIGTRGEIFACSLDGHVHALGPDGQRLWTARVTDELYSSPAVGPDGTVYVGGYGGRLYALDTDGTTRWVASTDSRISYSSPAIAADGTIYVGAHDGRLYAFNTDGTPRWTFDTGGAVTQSSPAIGPDGTVYVGSNNGKLFALSASAGPASGPWPMFRRDARHSASGFVTRELPPAYSPGGRMIVKLQATPPIEAGFYAVEDSPPPNWQVDNLSDDGLFDAADRKVRFGPFLDGKPRTLTYEVTPPLGESGLKQFSGSSSLAGVDWLTGGGHTCGLSPLHPADNNTFDGWLSISELTAYAHTWKTGGTWPISPGRIPPEFLDRALWLWQHGEQYRYDTNFTTAPLWWTDVSSRDYPSNLIHPEAVVPVTITQGSATADLPTIYEPGTPLRVSITAKPAAGVVVYAVEDQVPEGWTVSAVSQDGKVDPLRGKVKWGPFFDPLERTLSYDVIPPLDAADVAAFHGSAAFDDAIVQLDGRRQATAASAVSPHATRELTAGYSPGATFVVTLRVTPPPETVAYAVEETPPPNWRVSDIVGDGVFDSSSGAISFGPFLDNLERTLTYRLTPPLGETGLKRFEGYLTVNEATRLVGGDQRLEMIPLHPADNQPVDARLSIGEVTAYASAWKQGAGWTTPPTPIPVGYLTQAIGLWQGGELYRQAPELTHAPRWWVNLSAAQVSNIVIQATLPAPETIDEGTAQADLLAVYAPVTLLTITVRVTPGAGTKVYAVEDRPPEDWTVTDISDSGVFDRLLHKVKWGPFFDAAPRTLRYQVTPPAEAGQTAEFRGLAAFDAATVRIVGRRIAFRADTVTLPTLGSAQWVPEAGFRLTLSGLGDQVYLIEASSDLIDWVVMGLFTNTTGSLEFIDSEATHLARRFYRAVWP